MGESLKEGFNLEQFKQELKELATEFADARYIVFTKGQSAEVVDAKRRKAAELYPVFIDMCFEALEETQGDETVMTVIDDVLRMRHPVGVAFFGDREIAEVYRTLALRLANLLKILKALS